MNWMLLAADPASADFWERMIDRFGLPLIGLVVVGWAFIKVVQVAFAYFEKKDSEQTKKNDDLTNEIKQVRDAHITDVRTIAQQSVTACEKVTELGERMVAQNVDTQILLRKVSGQLDAMDSSDRRRAVT